MKWKNYLSASSFIFITFASSPQLTVQDEVPLISTTTAEPIPDSYIVVLKDSVDSSALQNHFTWLTNFIEFTTLKDSSCDSELNHIYDQSLFKGYSGKFCDTILDTIRKSADVQFVERDSIVYANTVQKNSPWGLARISHRSSLTFSTFNKYLYHPQAGEHVTAYIVDTGVNISHKDFEGRAVWGKTIPNNDEDIDGNGHGTHVAGTVAGKRYGVAKNAKIVAVKVLRSNGTGSMSDVVKGVDWTIGAHRKELEESSRNGTPFKGSVANMSLGGGMSRALNAAVNAAVDSGVLFAVAAGNDNANACDYSPASAEKAITVGASTFMDYRAYFSNFGHCVDVFAPGKDITSTWIGSNIATNTISGTSMASPHVAGLAAYFLSIEPSEDSVFFTSKPTPKSIKDKIIKLATKDALEDIDSDTPNLLIFDDPPRDF